MNGQSIVKLLTGSFVALSLAACGGGGSGGSGGNGTGLNGSDINIAAISANVGVDVNTLLTEPVIEDGGALADGDPVELNKQYTFTLGAWSASTGPEPWLESSFTYDKPGTETPDFVVMKVDYAGQHEIYLDAFNLDGDYDDLDYNWDEQAGSVVIFFPVEDTAVYGLDIDHDDDDDDEVAVVMTVASSNSVTGGLKSGEFLFYSQGINENSCDGALSMNKSWIINFDVPYIRLAYGFASREVVGHKDGNQFKFGLPESDPGASSQMTLNVDAEAATLTGEAKYSYREDKDICTGTVQFDGKIILYKP